MIHQSGLLVDVVNFNADASCLDASHWLKGLQGKQASILFKWLSLYVEFKRPIVLGLTGGTVADMMVHNPESIALINAHRDIFQIITRPFSHDAALLRSPRGFYTNYLLGKMILERVFGQVAPYFLPPEFMLTPEQVQILQTVGIDTTFINAERYGVQQGERIPKQPYLLAGLLGSDLGCVPLHGVLTRAYICALDRADATPWNESLKSIRESVAYSWRDGESILFFPQGLTRERLWLKHESERDRVHLDVRRKDMIKPRQDCPVPYFASYPVHSLSAWMKEFRMMGYIQRVLKAEERLEEMRPVATGLWLQCINSDVLSSVEKNPVSKELFHPDKPDHVFKTTFHRSERGFEGSEYLLLLESMLEGKENLYLERSSMAHMKKLRGRIQIIKQLLNNKSLGELIHYPKNR